MVAQYIDMGPRNGDLDHRCMTAGEEALEVLEAAGLVRITDIRGGVWTDLARAVLANGPAALEPITGD